MNNWPFTKQVNKFGYSNNPNWTPQGTFNHLPCGHWWEGPKLRYGPEDPPVIVPPSTSWIDITSNTFWRLNTGAMNPGVWNGSGWDAQKHPITDYWSVRLLTVIGADLSAYYNKVCQLRITTTRETFFGASSNWGFGGSTGEFIVPEQRSPVSAVPYGTLYVADCLTTGSVAWYLGIVDRFFTPPDPDVGFTLSKIELGIIS